MAKKLNDKRFIKGLFKDTSAIDQPEGTWRHARNMVVNDTDGAISNEGGTELSGHLGANNTTGAVRDKVIGAIEVNDDKVILFIVDPLSPSPRSEIGVWENGEYIILFNPSLSPPTGKPSNDLNFKESNPIEGTFKVDSKGDLVVYWTDDLNPPRAFNVNRQIRESGDGDINTITSSQLYGITSLDLDNINILNLFPYSGPVPHIYLHDIFWADENYQQSITTGGGLLTGVYHLGLAYVDDDQVATNYLTISNPVSIVEEYDHTVPTTKKDGAKAGSQTSKAIKWRVNNINTDYKYMRPVIIRKNAEAVNAFKLNIIEINPDVNGDQEIVFSGLEGFTSSSVEDVIIDTVSYETSKTINQLDGVLYLGNLTGTQDLGYQKYANNIKLSARTKIFKNFDTFYATIDNLQSGFGNSEVNVFDGQYRNVDESQSYRYAPNITNWKGYQRDEIYAFYIAFILKDGSMSYAYHIPGRAPLDQLLQIDGNQTLSTYNGKTIYEHSALGDDGNGSASNMISGSDDLLSGNNTRIYEDLHKLSIPYSRNFHFFDFSSLPDSNNMNYWENATETYPNTDNYDIWDETGKIGSLRNDGINNTRAVNTRHHKFPSNSNPDFTTVMEHLPDESGRSGDNCEVEPTDPSTLISSSGGWDVSFYAFAESKVGLSRSGSNLDMWSGPLGDADCGYNEVDFPNSGDGVTSIEFGYPSGSGHPGTNDTIADGDDLQIATHTTDAADDGDIEDVVKSLHSLYSSSGNYWAAWNPLTLKDSTPYNTPQSINTEYDPTKEALTNNQPLPVQAGGITSYDKFNNTFVTHPTSAQLQAFNLLWDGSKGVFTADQKMTVKIYPSIWLAAGKIDHYLYNPLDKDNFAIVARKRHRDHQTDLTYKNGFQGSTNPWSSVVAGWGTNLAAFNKYMVLPSSPPVSVTTHIGSALKGQSGTGRGYCVCGNYATVSGAQDLNNQYWNHIYAGENKPMSFQLEAGDEVHLGFMVYSNITSASSGDNLMSTYDDHHLARLKHASGCHDWDTNFSSDGKPTDNAVTGWHKFNVSQSQIKFEVKSAAPAVDSFHYNDVKIEHQVQALGFSLRDIKIPKSIADKVQGFRIYHAKRKHSNKSILGQAPSLPMEPDEVKVGMCAEAWGQSDTTNGAEIMASISDKITTCFRKAPFATWSVFYPSYPVYRGEDNIISKPGYKVFSFPSFNLLRTKNSISGATHIKPVYRVDNFVWNGPTLTQDKKMVTEIEYDTAYEPPLKRLVENWGYDTSFNCYSSSILSALFIGAHYNIVQSTNTLGGNGGGGLYRPFNIPRVLGQKAVTYLRGDSVFNAESLGFGGTILNERGDSSLIYALKDYHEIEAYSQSLSSSCSPYSAYGSGAAGTQTFLLVGDPITGLTGSSDATFPPGSCNRKSIVSIDNLCSFKTDVYKSIDDQELIWTGFEVLGSDLNNFIFWDSEAINLLPDDNSTSFPNIGDAFSFSFPTAGNIPASATANYNIQTLQQYMQLTYSLNLYDEEWGQWHIFGGDTFICRYGFGSGVTYLDSGSNSQPRRGVHYHIIESSDNINFRHSESTETSYFPSTSARDILVNIGRLDLHVAENITYNNNYSALNDIRPAFPLPLFTDDQSDFPTRTHRSTKADTTSLIDNYRIFKANQFKDLPKNRGELWKLASFNNLLYFHMQESLYSAKGKQSMQMKDGSEAFVGSGDIFQQDPDEVIQTKLGYGGTQSQWAALTSRAGYFFIDSNSRKIFLMKDKLSEISKVGMESWFKDNMGFELEDYGYTGCNIDNPIAGQGFHSVYDPLHKRIILTKREFIPTKYFIIGLNSDTDGAEPCPQHPVGKIRFDSTKCLYEIWGLLKDGSCGWSNLSLSCGKYFTCTGWTISYYTELGIWGSFHDYVPYIYFNTSTDFYSLTDQYSIPAWTPSTLIDDHEGTTFGNAGIWKHNSPTNYGILYQENQALQYSNEEWLTSVDYHSFEFELIHNEAKSVDSLLSSFSYTLETINQSRVSVLEHGFTSYFVYNTFQISGEETIQYLINTRRIGNSWKINAFRDIAALVNQLNENNLPNTSPYYTATGTNIIGGVNTGTMTTSSMFSMFNIAGMTKTINTNYIDVDKIWTQRRKFIDKWVGIRLIYDNITNNLLNLYSTNVVIRKLYR